MIRIFITFSYLLFCFQLFSPTVNAQTMQANGWESIHQNEFKSAKGTFEASLEIDSTDYEALLGMLFISEIESNLYEYKKYLNTLIGNHPEDRFLRLVTSRFEGDNTKLIENDQLQETSKILPRLRHSWYLIGERKFDEAKRYREKVLGNLNWEVLGPFQNESGIGYQQVLPPELEKKESYTNCDGTELSWMPIRHNDSWGILEFSNYLLERDNGNAFYARTKFSISEEQSVQFRLARNAPGKMWLNGELIFAEPENVAFNRDMEIVEAKLAPGNYELMTKFASLPKAYSPVSFLSFDGKRDKSNFGNNSFGYGGGNYASNTEFCLRITDTNGKPLTLGDFEATGTQSTDFEYKTVSHALTNYFEEGKLWDDYLLCLASIKAGQNVEAEELFLKKYEANQDKVLYQYLLAKLYATNGKQEKAYLVLKNVDLEKSPIFDLKIEELSEIDSETNGKKYLEKLEEMLEIYPTNPNLMRKKIDYLESKVGKDEMKEYVKSIIEKYPYFKDRFEYYLKQDDKDFYDSEDIDKKKEFKEALKSIKNSFAVRDYQYVANYYMEEEDDLKKALEIHNELIGILPYQLYLRLDKIEMLVEEKEFQKAESELEKLQEMYPYNTRILKDLGKVAEELNKEDVALDYYEKAFNFVRKGGGQGYGLKELEENIEKLSKSETVLDMCNEIQFEDVLSDDGWEEDYADEDAIVLLYSKDMVYEENRKLTVRQKLLVKILNEAGVRQWTEASLGFLGNITMVKLIKPDGAEISPERSWGQVVFKDLEPGDIIQAVGTNEGWPEEIIAGEWTTMNYWGWENTPMYRSKLQLLIPKEQSFFYECHKMPCENTKTEQGDYFSYNWDIKDLPKPKYEEGIPDQFSYWPYVMFSTIEDWGPFVEWYEGKTYKIPEYSYELDEIIEGAKIVDTMTDREKVAALYNYITTDITYSYVPFLQNNYVPQKPGQICASKIGDCKDVSSLMIALLRKLDIESYYVLVRTTHMAHDKLLPSNTFNHVIVGYDIDDKMEFMDLTTDYYPYYTIHEFDSDAWALAIRPGEKDLFQLPNDLLDAKKNNLKLTIDAQLKEDLSLEMTTGFDGKGLIAAWFREYLNNTSEEEHSTLFSNWAKESVDNIEIKELGFDNLKVIDPPLTGQMSMYARNFADKVSRFRILSIPLVFSMNANDFMNEEVRYNNLDLRHFDLMSHNEQVVNLSFPPGYRPLELPDNIELKSRFGMYSLKFSSIPNGMKIERVQHFNQKIIQRKDYTEFKAFFNQMVEADDTKFIIQK